jgi:alanine racemase
MSLTLTVDGDRWRRQLSAVAAANPGMVPVAKGNGYGLTIGRLARRAQWLRDRGAGTDTVAVGTYAEVPGVVSRFSGSVVVLTPWRPFGAALALDPALAARVVHTVSRPTDLSDLLGREPAARFLLEQRTSMRRHGMTPAELADAVATPFLGAGRCEGVTAHLPLARASQLPELTTLLDGLSTTGLAMNGGGTTYWVSHVSTAELDHARAAYPQLTFRPRIGTELWLGDRGALAVSASVLDVHELRRGDHFGYRGRRAARDGTLVVASGGTRHGRAVDWTPSARSAHRSPTAGASSTSPSHHTCRPRCCSGREANPRPASVISSTSGCASPQPSSTKP